jgi:hypothetical protein
MKTLKREEIYIRDYRDLEHLLESVEGFIENYYNGCRLHSALCYRSFEEFENESEDRKGHVSFRGTFGNETVCPLNCLTKGFTATVLEQPSCTKTVPKPYVIGASGLTSSEKQIPRNC